MIRYRPHRGTLSESMKLEKVFNSIDEMFEFIILDINNHGFHNLYNKEDLSITDDLGKDNRIDWKECRYVCTKRIGHEIYKTPQCIGMCSIED